MIVLYYCLVCLLYVATSILAENVCVQKSPCKCEFPNGTGIDMTAVANSTFYTTQHFHSLYQEAQIDLLTYVYRPCTDAVPIINGRVDNNNCNQSLSLYRQRDSMVRDHTSSVSYRNVIANHCEYLGRSDRAVFRNDGRAIIYKNGPSQTTVLLVCAQTDGDLRALSLDDPQSIVLQFFTRYACVERLEGSHGSTLFTILYSFAFGVVLGVCATKFLLPKRS